MPTIEFHSRNLTSTMTPTTSVDTDNSTLHNSHDVPWFPFSIPQDAWKVQDADEEVR